MLLIDGTYVIYKSFYRTKNVGKNITIHNDTHFKKIARNNFMKILKNIVEKCKYDHLFIVFDEDGENFRNELLPSYKATRKEKEPELKVVKKEVYRFLESNHFCFQIANNVEADDLIASYIYQHPQEKIGVYTGDKDLAALVNQNVTLFLDKDGKIQEVTIHNFHHFFNVPPPLFADFKSLQGDKSDNIKGVEGLFRTEALHLLLEYGCIETFFKEGENHHLYDKLCPFEKQILLNKQVATLKKDCLISLKHKNDALVSNYVFPHSYWNRKQQKK